MAQRGKHNIRRIGLPPQLVVELRDALLRCSPIADPGQLQAVFVDERLAPWLDDLPEAANAKDRAERLIALLAREEHVEHGPALPLFLRVLAGRLDPNVGCHGRLMYLAAQVEQATRSHTGTGMSGQVPTIQDMKVATGSDPFVDGALTDLNRSMTVMGYFMSRVEASPQSIISAIIEDETGLRVGISIHPDPDMRVNDLLSRMSRELDENLHDVSGIFAIQQGYETEMQPYQLHNDATPDAMHVKWNEIDGREPLGQGIVIFFKELRGSR